MPTKLTYTTGGLPVAANHDVDLVMLEVGRSTQVAFEPKDAAELG